MRQQALAFQQGVRPPALRISKPCAVVEECWWVQEDSSEAEMRSKGAGPRPPQMRPQQVWVLMGGESSERQLSLQAGLNVWLQLQDDPTMEVGGSSSHP